MHMLASMIRQEFFLGKQSIQSSQKLLMMRIAQRYIAWTTGGCLPAFWGIWKWSIGNGDY